MTGSNFDYYKILGLAESTTFEEIKQKYHELAIKFHPDKMKSSLAEIMMKQINEAYDVLSDPIKRATYDKSHMSNEIKSEIGSQSKKSKKQFNDVLDKLAKHGKQFYKGMAMFSNGINKFSKEMNKFSHTSAQNENNPTSKIHTQYNNPSRKPVKQVHVYHHYDNDDDNYDDYDKDTQIPNKTYEQNRKFAENLFSSSDSNKTIEYDDYGYNVENIYDADYDKSETKRRKAKHTNTDDYGFNAEDVFDL